MDYYFQTLGKLIKSKIKNNDLSSLILDYLPVNEILIKLLGYDYFPHVAIKILNLGCFSIYLYDEDNIYYQNKALNCHIHICMKTSFYGGKAVYYQYINNNFTEVRLNVISFDNGIIKCIINEYKDNVFQYILTHKTKKKMVKFTRTKIIKNNYKWIKEKLLRDLRYSLSTMLMLISKYTSIIMRNSIDQALGRCPYILCTRQTILKLG